MSRRVVHCRSLHVLTAADGRGRLGRSGRGGRTVPHVPGVPGRGAGLRLVDFDAAADAVGLGWETLRKILNLKW